MIENFWFNVEYGMNHVLDINAYDHVLFLIVLTIPYLFKDWKRVLLLVSVFTIGHTLSLTLAAYGAFSVSDELVEFLIPVTILIVALFNVFTAGKGAQREKVGVLFLSTLFFGLVHGMGFAREFRMFVGNSESKLVPLLEFALGIEIAQVNNRVFSNFLRLFVPNGIQVFETRLDYGGFFYSSWTSYSNVIS